MKSLKKIIYISGPYTSKNSNPFEVHRNILTASEYAIKVWKCGAVAICPHLNTYLFEFYAKEIDDNELWLGGDLEIIKRCDAVLAIPQWRLSKGAKIEVNTARKNNIPVFYSIKQIKEFIKV